MADEEQSGARLIGNVEYAFIEFVDDVDELLRYVICSDAQGNKRCVDEARWLASPSTGDAGAIPSATHYVTSRSSDADKISLFMSLFRGREDVYAESYVSKKTAKLHYGPACANKWVRPICNMRKVPCRKCTHGVFRLLSTDIVKAHLEGKKADGSSTIGVYPVVDGNYTHSLVADFDEGDWHFGCWGEAAVPRRNR